MEKLKTKIIATIGPSTLEYSAFRDLILAGVDFVRINTSYGNIEQYDKIISMLRGVIKQRYVEPILDIKNFEMVEYARRQGIRNIALSLAENPDQIKQVRNAIYGAFVISKIESVKGVANFDEILEVSDGIMVARGDLGEAVSLEKVPPLQKEFTHKALSRGKFLVTATEMLLSMVEKREPTRAEVSDVANAVFDHSSAVMLSEETAIGKYPVETVKMMRRIVFEAEKWNKSLK